MNFQTSKKITSVLMAAFLIALLVLPVSAKVTSRYSEAAEAGKNYKYKYTVVVDSSASSVNDSRNIYIWANRSPEIINSKLFHFYGPGVLYKEYLIDGLLDTADLDILDSSRYEISFISDTIVRIDTEELGSDNATENESSVPDMSETNNLLGNIKDTLSNLSDSITNPLNDGLDNVRKTVKNVGDTVGKKIDDVKDTISDGFSDVTTFIGDVVSAVTELPDAIAGAISDILTGIFVPSEDFLTVKVEALRARFDWIDPFIDFAESLSFGSAEPPVIYIPLDDAEGSYYFGPEMVFVDMSWYVRYKALGDLILSGFLWALFGWRMYVKLPGIINGVAGTIGRFG